MKKFPLIGAPVLAMALFAQVIAVTPAWAQAFPNKLVKMVVPYTTGGSTDAGARGVAQRLAEIWGQPVIIENRPGAGTTVGAEFVAKASPDGYTLLFSDSSTYVITPHLFSKLNFDILTDLAPITVVFHSYPVLVMSNAVPARNFKEFLAYARANPGKLSYASFGNGSSAHITIEKLKQMAGIDLVHVPYKGGGPALTDLIAGRVAITTGSYGLYDQHEKMGKLKIIAALSEKRPSVRPDLPTVSESGVQGYFVKTWFAMAAPAGTQASVLDTIHAGVVKVLRDPGFNEKFIKPQSFEPGGSSRAEFASMLKIEYARWGQFVRETGAKLD